jgi:ABC-2 type transport system permease protein
VISDVRAWWAGVVTQTRTLSRYPTEIVSVLVWPLMLPVVYVLQARAFAGGSPAATAAFVQRTGTASVVGFLFVGFAVYMWISNVLWGPGTQLRQVQQLGILEALYLTPANRAALLFASSGGFLVLSLLMMTLVGLVLRVVFAVELTPAEVLRALAVIAVAILPMYGMGAAFAVLVMVFKEFSGMVQFLRGLFQVLCGITFPIVVLPAWAQRVALALPPTHILSGVREVLLGGAGLAQVSGDLVSLAVAGLLLCALGLFLFNAAERYARRTGGLGQY